MLDLDMRRGLRGFAVLPVLALMTGFSMPATAVFADDVPTDGPVVSAAAPAADTPAAQADGTVQDIRDIGSLTVDSPLDENGQPLGTLDGYGGHVARFPMHVHFNDPTTLQKGVQVAIPYDNDYDAGTGHYVLTGMVAGDTVNASDGTQLFSVKDDPDNKRILLTATDHTSQFASLDVDLTVSTNLYINVAKTGISQRRSNATSGATVYTFAGQSQTVHNTELAVQSNGWLGATLQNTGASDTSFQFAAKAYFNKLINDMGSPNATDLQALSQPYGFLIHVASNSSPITFSKTQSQSAVNFTVNDTTIGDLAYKFGNTNAVTTTTSDKVDAKVFDSPADMMKLLPQNTIATRQNSDGTYDIAIVMPPANTQPFIGLDPTDARRDEQTETMLTRMQANDIPFGEHDLFLYFQWASNVGDQSATITSQAVFNNKTTTLRAVTIHNVQANNSGTGTTNACMPTTGTTSSLWQTTALSMGSMAVLLTGYMINLMKRTRKLQH